MMTPRRDDEPPEANLTRQRRSTWFDTTAKRITALGAAVAVLASSGAWLDSRYAKAGDLRELKDLQRFMLFELRVGQLENRRAILRSELRTLEAIISRTVAEKARLQMVADELRDVEKDIDRVRSEKAGLSEPTLTDRAK
jgi:hypothetical protein